MQNLSTPVSAVTATTGRSGRVVADDLKDVFRSIYQHRYFTNHGPSAQAFELLLQEYLDIKHVVAVGNESLALLIAVAGLAITGEIVIPAYRAAIAANIAAWLGLSAIGCDVDFESQQVSIESISPALSKNTAAVVLVETWGNRCDKQVVEFLTARKLKVIIIAFDSFASESDQRHVIDDPDVITVHSFGPDQLLTTLQGGSIATSDDELAHRFRSIRSSYGVRETRRVRATCNGRFSEFQAGLGIKQFSTLQQRQTHYRKLADCYRSILAEVEGIKIYDFPHTQVPNGQFFPIRFEPTFPMSKDELAAELELHVATASDGGSVIQPAGHDDGAAVDSLFPVAQRLASQVLTLPISCALDTDAATQLAEMIGRIN